MHSQSLTMLQLDALREIGSIGAGHAATVLSQLVDRPISLELPHAEILGLRDVSRIFGGPETLVVAVYSRLVGDVAGGMLFMADRPVALAFIDMLHGREVGTSMSLNTEGEELLCHAATVLISAYLAAITRLADVHILPSEPSMAYDMAGALLEAVVAEVGMEAEEAIIVRTSFVDRTSAVDAALYFLPDPDSLLILLGRLGVK